MADAPRFAEKFVSRDGLLSYSFPGDNLEYQAAQEYRRAEGVAVGADYAHDYAGGLAWPRAVGEERVRFTIWATSSADADTAFDSCASTLRRAGLGKLYIVDSAGNERWCYAKLQGRPSYTVNQDSYFDLEVECVFARYSNWKSTTLTTGTATITTSPQSFTINNPGNARVEAIVFRLRANTATGFNNPSLTNTTTLHSFSTTRDAASANSEVKVDCERNTVTYSNDDGSSYTDDYANFSYGATQVAFMVFDPGDNTVQYAGDGTERLDVSWSFYAEWE